MTDLVVVREQEAARSKVESRSVNKIQYIDSKQYYLAGRPCSSGQGLLLQGKAVSEPPIKESLQEVRYHFSALLSILRLRHKCIVENLGAHRIALNVSDHRAWLGNMAKS